MPFYYTLLLCVTNMLSRKRTDTTHPAKASSLSGCTNYTPTTSNFSIFVLLTGKFCLFPSISCHSSLLIFEFCFWKNLSSWTYRRCEDLPCVPIYVHASGHPLAEMGRAFSSEIAQSLAGQSCILAKTALKQFCSIDSFALLLTLCPTGLVSPNKLW